MSFAKTWLPLLRQSEFLAWRLFSLPREFNVFIFFLIERALYRSHLCSFNLHLFASLSLFVPRSLALSLTLAFGLCPGEIFLSLQGEKILARSVESARDLFSFAAANCCESLVPRGQSISPSQPYFYLFSNRLFFLSTSSPYSRFISISYCPLEQLFPREIFCPRSRQLIPSSSNFTKRSFPRTKTSRASSEYSKLFHFLPHFCPTN